MSRVRLALEQMQLAIDKIQRYTPPSREAFVADEMRRDSIERNLIMLGDAATRIPRDFQDAHPEIPWGQIIGMRNTLTHEYDKTKPEIVWNTIVNDLDPLRQRLDAVLSSPTFRDRD